MADGYSYQGIFHRGEKHNFGQERSPDGSYYFGDFRKNLRHGKGLLIFNYEEPKKLLSKSVFLKPKQKQKENCMS